MLDSRVLLPGGLWGELESLTEEHMLNTSPFSKILLLLQPESAPLPEWVSAGRTADRFSLSTRAPLHTVFQLPHIQGFPYREQISALYVLMVLSRPVYERSHSSTLKPIQTSFPNNGYFRLVRDHG